MNSKRFLVKLTPHGPFFFGGEQSFGGTDGNQANYLVKSNYFPQQTGVMGLIRHQLLIQNGLLTNDKINNVKKASSLIGAKSFRIGEPDLTFGVIEKISPLFMTHQEDHYFPVNKEYQVDKEHLKIRKFEKNGELPLLVDFNPKNGLPDLLTNQNLTSFKYFDFDGNKPYSGFFIPQTQTGIRKNYKGVTDKESYYIQTFYQLTKGTAFSCIVEMKVEDDGNPVVFKSRDHVVFGGEQSAFKMEVTNYDVAYDTLLPTYEPHEMYDKIVLVSDCYLPDNQLFDDAEFAIAETREFRFLETEVATTENYAALTNKSKSNGGKLVKSKKYSLLQKGSVIYSTGEKTDKIKRSLTNEIFQTIGYNEFKLINKKES